MIFVTGGGFISANRARMPQLRMFLAEKNFVVASINYRTFPNAKFPLPLEDVKASIRFLKANAQKFNVDAEKIFLIGDSAGGFLTTFAAITNEEKILAAVDLYGVSDLKAIAKIFPLAGFYDAADEIDPIKYVTKNSAPMLILHGTADNIVSPAQSDSIFQALKNHGVEAERYLIPNANHADEYWQQEEVLELIAKFLTAHL